MALIGANELASIRATWASSLMDTCKVWTYSGSQDSYGQIVPATPVWANISAIACGFEPRSSRETQYAGRTVGAYSEYDAILRVALGTTIATKDRVQLTKRYGATLSVPLTFEVSGPPMQGSAGIVAPLKAVA